MVRFSWFLVRYEQISEKRIETGAFVWSQKIVKIEEKKPILAVNCYLWKL